MNSRRDSLPDCYWLKEVSIVGAVYARGGEAVIHRGEYKGVAVAIRQFPADDVDWASEDGKVILRVSNKRSTPRQPIN